jgi:hypothetical protein
MSSDINGCSRQGGGLNLRRGAALTDAEREQIVEAARTEASFCGGAVGTRLFEDAYELKTGKPVDATRGLEDRMCVNSAVFHRSIAEGVDTLEAEAQQFAAGTSEEGKELLELLDYVLNQKTSEKVYPNGTRDEGRGGVRPSYFLSHANAQRAKLSDKEVFALRLYTTPAFRHINNPLRDDNRYARSAPVPLPAASVWAASAILKLRALRTHEEGQEVVLWRGMRSMRATEAFLRQGGTELAFMSTTTDLRVAVRYALSQDSLLLRIVAPSFMSLGADLRWLSAFPGEAEVLFPPLTFLKPTGRTDRVEAADSGGRSVTFTVIEVAPFIG